MKKLKSHFLQLNKRQRNGVFFLAFLIIIFQILYFAVDFTSHKLGVDFPVPQHTYNLKIDSIKQIALNNRKTVLYTFNPNFLTDFRASKLGMSVAEIDRLLAYRKTGKYVNSAKEFQQVTKVNDSLLSKIKGYFKFPEWVKNKTKFNNQNKSKDSYKSATANFFTIQDINTATAQDLQRINGIGKALSARIIKYRNKLGGFYFKDQLSEVYGLSPEVIQKTQKQFKILSKPKIKKLNINEATFKQVLHLPYIDYELTKKIFNYRDEFAEIQSLEELKKIDGFPLDKYDRIILYLSTK